MMIGRKKSLALSVCVCVSEKKKEKKRRSPIENVINLFSNVGSQTQELPVDPMEGGLEEVPLSGVLAVEQI